MRILLTGGTRFLGPCIVKELVNKGHTVTVVNRGITPAKLPPEVKKVKGDKEKRKEFKKILEQLDYEAVIDTILNTEDLGWIIAMIKDKITHFIHCGTTGVYAPMKKIPALEEDKNLDPPTYLGYFAEKLRQDKLLIELYEEENFPVTILRCSYIYGPGDIPLDIWGSRNIGFFKRLRESKTIAIPNDGRALLQPCYVEDIASAFALVLENKDSIGQIYNISSSRAVTLNEYAKLTAKILDSKSSFIHIPVEHLVNLFKDNGQKIILPNLLFLCEHMCVDISKAVQELGYSPQVPLEVGMKRNIEWMVNEGLLE
jgi:nucleoside-diphosphate-sugar epimerase